MSRGYISPSVIFENFKDLFSKKIQEIPFDETIRRMEKIEEEIDNQIDDLQSDLDVVQEMLVSLKKWKDNFDPDKLFGELL